MRNAARREARGWPEAYTLRGIPPLRAQDLPFLLFARCVDPSGKADSARIINAMHVELLALRAHTMLQSCGLVSSTPRGQPFQPALESPPAKTHYM